MNQGLVNVPDNITVNIKADQQTIVKLGMMLMIVVVTWGIFKVIAAKA